MNENADEPQIDEVAAPREGARILQVLPALGQGGVERGTIDLARYMTRHGWQSLVASSGGPGEAALEEFGATSLRLPLASKNPLRMGANVARLQRIIRGHRVQLVHARSRAPAWSAYFAARRCGIPFVTTFHGVYDGSERGMKRRYNAIMARGDRVIAISDYVAEHVRARYGVGPERLRTVRRGVDLAVFDPQAVSAERIEGLASQWQIPRDRKVLMLPGRITRIKGHQLLLRALERLNRRDFLCLMVGDLEPRTSYLDEVERLIDTLGLSDRVRMVGACRDMPAALSLADVVVVPAIGPEAFGRTSVEAQAMGKPVVVADIGGLGETVMPAATGWLVPTHEIEPLTQALDLALAMPEDVRVRLAERARRFVVHNFSLDGMGRRTLAVYRELLDRSGARMKLEDSTGIESGAASAAA